MNLEEFQIRFGKYYLIQSCYFSFCSQILSLILNFILSFLFQILIFLPYWFITYFKKNINQLDYKKNNIFDNKIQNKILVMKPFPVKIIFFIACLFSVVIFQTMSC